MKKIVFGGFYMIVGVLLFATIFTADRSIIWGTGIPEVLLYLAAAALVITGLIYSIKGLKQE